MDRQSNGTSTSWVIYFILTSKFIYQVSPEVIKKETARFAQIWNEIVTSFRAEDLINDKYTL